MFAPGDIQIHLAKISLHKLISSRTRSPGEVAPQCFIKPHQSPCSVCITGEDSDPAICFSVWKATPLSPSAIMLTPEQIGKYLERLKIPRKHPDLGSLNELIRAQLQTVPYENLFGRSEVRLEGRVK